MVGAPAMSAPLHPLNFSAFAVRTPRPLSLSTRVATQSAAPSISTIPPSSSIPSKKKVLVPIGMGTEEMEAVVLVDVLRRAGADVTVASVERELQIKGSSETKLVADAFIGNCASDVFDLVALPGGMPGSVNLRDCQVLQEITTKQAGEKRLYGAICAAPAVVLVPWGLHKRKDITCHPAFKDMIPTFRQVSSNVQVSGVLTTSRGPGTTFEFALSFVKQLFGSDKAQDMSNALMMQIDGGHGRSKEFNSVDWTFEHIPRVLVPVANGSEEMEVVILVDILRRARADVILASVERKTQILGSQKMKIIADECISDSCDSTYDLIILPGGVDGAERLNKSRVLKKLLREHKEAGKVYGGTHSSPVILDKYGLLEDKIVAAHPSSISQLSGRTDVSGVVIDGNLITGKGLATVTDFSLAIVRKLFGHERAKSLAAGLVFDYS